MPDDGDDNQGVTAHKSYFTREIQVVYIELTNFCNLKCLYCSRNKFGNDRPIQYMKLDMLESIVKMFPKTVMFGLYSGGEPLAHPQFPEAIRIANHKGNRTRIHTNGTLLTRELSAKIVEAGLTDIVFSIDGTDPEDYERIRGVKFEKVHENLSEFLEINEGKVQVGVNCLVGAGKELQLNSGLSDLEEFIDFKILDHPHSWLYGKEIPEWVDQGVIQIPCLFLQSYMVVAVDGDYLLCCHCLNKEKILGNIKDRTAQEIYDNEMEAIRQKQIAGDFIRPCSNCDRYRDKSKKEREC